RLYDEGLIVLELLQGVDDGVITLPIACGFAGTAINYEVSWTLTHLLVQVVHEHAHGGFLLPTLAGERRATRGPNRGIGSLIDFRLNRHQEDSISFGLSVQCPRIFWSGSYQVLEQEQKEDQRSLSTLRSSCRARGLYKLCSFAGARHGFTGLPISGAAA